VGNRNGGLSAAVDFGSLFGGADEDRTHDLLNAIQALSQLSYGPTHDSGASDDAVDWRLDGAGEHCC